MKDNEPYQILSMLKSVVPEFRNDLDAIYHRDPVFREIAKEYFICVRKQDMILKATGEKDESYEQTITELKEELLDYFKNWNTDKQWHNNK